MQIRRLSVPFVVVTIVSLIGASSATGQTTPSGNGSTDTATQPPSGTEPELGTLDLTTTTVPDAAFDSISQAAVDRGTVPVIVGLQVAFTPEGLLTAQEVQAQRAAIASAGAGILNALHGTAFTVNDTYDAVPYVALSLPPAAVEALRASGLAATIQEDVPDPVVLDTSTPIVEATEAATLGRTGKGRTVVVLDTGVDKDHPFIGTSQASNEACFSLGQDGVSGAGDCPNGSSTMIGTGAGEDCTYASQCNHGTHVAGIAMGGPTSGVSFSGVARNATLVPVEVFSKFTTTSACSPALPPCALSFTSDQLAGLNYVLNLPTTLRANIAAVNISIGGGIFTSPCDGDPRKAAIDNLLSVGVATVIAAGNNGSNSGVSAPGCISTAVTVGATDDADNVASFSNSSPLIDLLAPGVSIQSSVPNSGDPATDKPFAFFNGTSMATPHVVGAFADIDQINPASTAAQVNSHLAALQSTGVPVTDPDNSVTKPRIRILAASVQFKDTGFKSGGKFSGTGFNVVSNGVGLATRAGGPSSGSIALSGVPSGATKRNAFLYWATIGGPDATAVLDGVSRAGTLIGASRDTCWGIGINRVYRATLPLSAITSAINGSYAVSGIGGSAGVDGQGASLVVVYSTSSSQTGLVHINHGAMTVNATGATMTHTFKGLSLPSGATSAHENVGVGDGQPSFTEGPKKFQGTSVTASDWLSGTDGSFWDDQTFAIPTSLLPAGTTSRTNSITTGNDCLVWAYAALQYFHP